MEEITIYTDGACSGNPGPGGWGIVVIADGVAKQLSGGEPMTTNNRMELTAVIKSLSALKEPCSVTLTTDSQYVVNSVTKGWVYNWAKKNWIKEKNTPVPNRELWQELLPLLSRHEVKFVWVRGHNGHPENERCDRLAVQQRDIHNN